MAFYGMCTVGNGMESGEERKPGASGRLMWTAAPGGLFQCVGFFMAGLSDVLLLDAFCPCEDVDFE